MSADIVAAVMILLFLLVGLLFGRQQALARRIAALEAALRDGQPGQGEATPLPKRQPWMPPSRRDEPTETTTDPAPKPEASNNPRQPRGPGAGERLGRWLRENWIYPVAGAALVMAGIYLVQYSIEKGLLSPSARIMLALLLGAALIAGAELLRRRLSGDAGLVPATLAGAGIATLFATVLAAFNLYDMLGQSGTLAALAAVALLSMALGWVQGPLLAAIGVIAGTAAPFLLGSAGAPMDLLYAYFGAVALLGLGIDGLRRWGWISALAIVLPLSAAVLIQGNGAGPEGLAILALVLALAGSTLPGGALMPRAQGSQAWTRNARPETRIAALAILGAMAVIVTQVEAPTGILASGLLAALLPLWTRHAPALSGLCGIAALGIPAAVGYSLIGTPLLLSYVLNAADWMIYLPAFFAVLTALGAFWRGEQAEGRDRVLWTLLGAFLPVATAVAVELCWKPQTLIGPIWPLIVMALAALQTGAALRFAKRDGSGQGARLGITAASAFTLIALALMLVLTEAALTASLAVLMLLAAAMDRRIDIPALGWVIGFGAMTMAWRMVFLPGLDPMIGGIMPSGAVALTLVSVLAGPIGALVVLHPMPRHPWREWGSVVAETALSALVPMVILVVIARFLLGISTHAAAGIEAATLIALARVQILRRQRLGSGRWMAHLRLALAWILGLAAAGAIVLLLTLLSPVWGFGEPVIGWPLLNDLALAYAAPAVVLWWASKHRLARAVAVTLAAMWVGVVIRHLWHGGTGMRIYDGVAQGELYAYTLALLAAGAGAIALALRQGVAFYRVAGLVLIGLGAAKAFLIDASGLTGLLRVGAFLGLGLALAALAWLNNWVIRRMGDRSDAP